MVGNGSMDAIEQVWWLAWTPFALLHGHSPFLSMWQNYPLGQNFGVNGSMLALGVIFSPITQLFGPVVTWNLALTLSPAISAASMCLVLRRWTTWWPSAFIGGLLYGFSSYAFYYGGVGGGYLFVIFVPLPPLTLLLLHEIVVRQQWRARGVGIALAVVCAVQFFISTEILASTALMAMIAVGLYVIANRHELAERWRYAVRAAAYALGTGFILLVAPTIFTLAGPQHINGVPTPPALLSREPTPLLAVFVPLGRWLNPQFVKAPGIGFVVSGALYLGVPLIVTLICMVVLFRKRGAIVFAGVMALISFILSLGPRVYIWGHTAINLPFMLLDHVPLIQGFQTARLSLFTILFASAVLAIGIDEIRLWLTNSQVIAEWRSRAGVWLAIVAAVVIAVVAMAPLWPAHTLPLTATSPKNVPSFFESNAVRSIPENSVVLVNPYPDQVNTGWSSILYPGQSILLDQAITGMRFKVIGGYGWFPSPSGHNGTINPAVLTPNSVQALFDTAFTGGTAAERQLLAKSNAANDLRVFLGNYDVQTIILLPQGKTPTTLINILTSVIGPPTKTGGVTVWFHVNGNRSAGSR
jgi:hypothetical protein